MLLLGPGRAMPQKRLGILGNPVKRWRFLGVNGDECGEESGEVSASAPPHEEGGMEVEEEEAPAVACEPRRGVTG